MQNTTPNNSQPPTRPHYKNSFFTTDPNSWQWKAFILYDVIMMFLIIINLIILATQALISSHFGAWLADILHLTIQRHDYIQHYSPIIQKIDFYFICFLVGELLLRWTISIIGKHHQRWWFFPFIHWYEVLSIIPVLRFLRLARAGIIAYRLHEMGYHVIPAKFLIRLKFYYDLVMEELTDRIILTAIKNVESELDSGTLIHQRIHKIIDHHREPFAQAVADILQKSLANALAKQQINIGKNIGLIVHRAVEETPEFHQLLALFPFVGTKIEHQLKVIITNISEKIAINLVGSFADRQPHGQIANPLLTEISQQLSQTPLDTELVDKLVESIVRESFIAINEQVSVKQWQLKLEQPTSSSS